MIYLNKPKKFTPKFEVVSCFIQRNDKFLLLLRQDYKPEGNTWGVPAGKVDDGESLSETVSREIFEETGLRFKDSEIKHFKKVYVRYPDYDFVYHIYSADINYNPEIWLNKKEHKKSCWVTPKKSLEMNLVPDEDACVKLFYRI